MAFHIFPDLVAGEYSVLAYTLVSVLFVSLVSFIGVVSISLGSRRLNKILLYLVSFAAGALMGDAFIHLLPEGAEEFGLSLRFVFYILSGIVTFFILEKIIHWHHHHGTEHKEEGIKPFAVMNLIGDGLHNFIDGLVIAGSYLIDIPLGIATTIAVILHEIPQEIGDFAVLLHGGFSRKKALLFNFLSAVTAILGAAVAIHLSRFGNVTSFLIPFTIGVFVYIAGSDLIPETHRENGMKQSILLVAAFLVGIGLMATLLLLE